LAIVVDDPVPEAAFFAFAHAAAEVGRFPQLRRRATGRTNSARPKSRRCGVRCGATRSSTWGARFIAKRGAFLKLPPIRKRCVVFDEGTMVVKKERCSSSDDHRLKFFVGPSV
jgi:hypothetical protein